MTTISAQDMITLRRKIDDPGAKAFSDPELDEIWVEAGENMNRAIYICFEELLNSAIKFTDYTQNQSTERRSQIFDHIAKEVLPYWKNKVETEKSSLRILGMKVRPPRRVERPYTDPHIDSDTDR